MILFLLNTGDKMAIPSNFWQEVERPLKYVLYGDTDSLYLKIDQKYDNIQDTITGTTETANNINSIIKNYFDSYLLPKLGVNPIYNKTFFKTELIAESIVFLETKKTYAFNQIYKEGKIYNPPETIYVGGSVVKSDTAPLTRDITKEVTEQLALNKSIQDKHIIDAKLKEISLRYWEKLNHCIKNLELEYISVPCKWGNSDYEKGDPSQIIAMRLYNTITETETFKENTYGFKIPINIKNPINFNNLITPHRNDNKYCINELTVDKINYIVMPYSFDKENLVSKLNMYGIHIDPHQIWEKMINTGAQRIIEIVKETYKLS